MARIRTIKPEFWTDAKTGTMPPMAKCLFLGLLNHCDDFGVIEFSPQEWRPRIFPYDTTSAQEITDLVMTQLVRSDLVELFDHGDGARRKPYLFIRNFTRHQVINRPSKPIIPGWQKGDTPKIYHTRGEELAAKAVSDAEAKKSAESMASAENEQKLYHNSGRENGQQSVHVTKIVTPLLSDTSGDFNDGSVITHGVLPSERNGKERNGREGMQGEGSTGGGESSATTVVAGRKAKVNGAKPAASKAVEWVCPAGVSEAAWVDWLRVRDKKKAAKSERAYTAAMKKLAEFVARGHLADTVVALAADNGWTDLYEPKRGTMTLPARRQVQGETI